MAAAYFVVSGVRNKASNSDFYKEQLIKNDIYERAYTDVIPALMKSGDNESSELFGGLEGKFRLTDANVEEIGRLLISKEDFLIPNVERLLDNGFDYLKNKTDDPNLVIDMTSIKTRAPGVLTDFALNLMRNLPECTPDKRLVVNDLILFRQGVVPSCFNELTIDAQTRAGVKAATGLDLPPRLTRDNFQPLIRPTLETQIRTAIGELPNQLDLIGEIAEQDNKSREEVLSDFDGLRRAFGFTTGAGLILLAVVMLLVLVVVYFLLRNSPVDPFLWIGTVLAFVGLFALIAALQAKSAVIKIIEEESVSQDRPEVAEVFRDLFTSMANSMASGFVTQSIFFLVGGLIIIGVGVFIIMKRKSLGAKS